MLGIGLNSRKYDHHLITIQRQYASNDPNDPNDPSTERDMTIQNAFAGSIEK
jgi:hypothetical protein